MASIGEGLRDIMFAGIGAVAVTAEKGKEIVDMLVEKGELTVDQGKQLNQELQRKAGDSAKGMRETAVEARMKVMSPDERAEFAAMVAEIAAQQNAADEAAAAEAAAGDASEVEVEAEVVEVETEEQAEAEPEA